MRYPIAVPMLVSYVLSHMLWCNSSVQQVMKQYPCSFEFTDILLMKFFEHAYSSEYGKMSAMP